MLIWGLLKNDSSESGGWDNSLSIGIPVEAFTIMIEKSARSRRFYAVLRYTIGGPIEL